MSYLVHQLVSSAANTTPEAPALIHGDQGLSYGELDAMMRGIATGLAGLGLQRRERVAVYLDKCPEAVIALFGASAAGGVFVPINPQLKADQLAYMLSDCQARILVTTRQRLAGLTEALPACPGLQTIVLSDEPTTDSTLGGIRIIGWHSLTADASPLPPVGVENDVAAILYTSGSTGRPKGVVISHRNLLAGAESVTSYLANTGDDRLLAVLPLSFDYGLSQLTTAFRVGACVVLLNYLLPRDVPRAVARHGITGLAAVPPLWLQLAELEWPAAARQHLRYITSSGGSMPTRVVDALRRALPSTEIVLMYGLTEAFRSTYLPPSEIDRRPDSIGIPVPNADIRVLREDGSECDADEPGELVHRGPFVTLGYWGDPERTAERFGTLAARPGEIPLTETAVWSGDTVRRDRDGYLYFLGRRDEMIKTSGYRVSPEEIEAIVYAQGLAAEAAAFGVPDATLGQAIALVVAPSAAGQHPTAEAVETACRQALPAFMVPRHIAVRGESLPRNPNGKIDRNRLRQQLQDDTEDSA